MTERHLVSKVHQQQKCVNNVQPAGSFVAASFETAVAAAVPAAVPAVVTAAVAVVAMVV